MKKILCVFLALLTATLTGCGGGKEVYSGEGYEFIYNAKKWELAFEDDDGMVSFKRKGFDDVSFGVYRYIPEEHISMNERYENSEEICETLGYIWDGGEIFDIDGREWGRAEWRNEIHGDMFKCINFLTDSGTYVYTVDLFSDADSFDKCIKDFEEVFYSFKITE